MRSFGVRTETAKPVSAPLFGAATSPTPDRSRLVQTKCHGEARSSHSEAYRIFRFGSALDFCQFTGHMPRP
jgi:hypothetical protein